MQVGSSCRSPFLRHYCASALVSGGSPFAGLLLTRSDKFEDYAQLLQLCFFDKGSIQLYLHLMQVGFLIFHAHQSLLPQSLWDPLDAASWTNGSVPTLLIGAKGDSQIHSLGSEYLARVLNASAPVPVSNEVWGVPHATSRNAETLYTEFIFTEEAAMQRDGTYPFLQPTTVRESPRRP